MHRFAIITVHGEPHTSLLLDTVTLHELLMDHHHTLFKHPRHKRLHILHSGLAAYLGRGHASVMVKGLGNDSLPLRQAVVGTLLIITVDLDKCLTLDFKTRRYSRLIYVAERTKIVLRHPFPQLELRMLQYGLFIK